MSCLSTLVDLMSPQLLTTSIVTRETCTDLRATIALISRHLTLVEQETSEGTPVVPRCAVPCVGTCVEDAGGEPHPRTLTADVSGPNKGRRSID